MTSLEKCRERARKCQRKAGIMSDPRDRALWLKLAEDWMAVSRIPFQSGSTADETHGAHSGLWRGQSVGQRSNKPRFTTATPVGTAL